MEKRKEIRHVQTPSHLEMEPDEKVLYTFAKQFMNQETQTAYPSLPLLVEKTGYSRKYIQKLLQSLEEKNFIHLIKREGQTTLIEFTPITNFEPFSYEFLNSPDISNDVKKYVICTQEDMVIDKGHHQGKISYSDRDLATRTKLSRHFITKAQNEMKKNDMLSIILLQMEVV